MCVSTGTVYTGGTIVGRYIRCIYVCTLPYLKTTLELPRYIKFRERERESLFQTRN